MNLVALQGALNVRGQRPLLVTDGISGRKTTAAIDALLADKSVDGWQNWSDDRRQVAAEQIIYRNLNIEIGKIDGLVGEQTRYARSVYEGRKANAGKPNPEVEKWRDADADKPSLSPVPVKTVVWPRQAETPTFYGAIGSNQTNIDFPFPMRLAWEPTTNVFRTSCHAKVAEPFKRIWKRALGHYGHDRIKQLRLDMFGGCLNVRKMRGGSSWSMHSWGIAMDIDPDRNQLKWGRDKAMLDDAAYAPFWGFVADEGGVSLGQARNYDWMHFQFARL